MRAVRPKERPGDKPGRQVAALPPKILEAPVPCTRLSSSSIERRVHRTGLLYNDTDIKKSPRTVARGAKPVPRNIHANEGISDGCSALPVRLCWQSWRPGRGTHPRRLSGPSSFTKPQPLARNLGGPGSAGTWGLSRKPGRRTREWVCRRRATDPKQAPPWQRKRPRPPLPGIREPGPYARDQVREETRTHCQHCKKRAAGICQKAAQSLAATVCGRRMA
jgi:hypothetical protein